MKDEDGNEAVFVIGWGSASGKRGTLAIWGDSLCDCDADEEEVEFVMDAVVKEIVGAYWVGGGYGADA